jgi:hypothetical protein
VRPSPDRKPYYRNRTVQQEEKTQFVGDDIPMIESVFDLLNRADNALDALLRAHRADDATNFGRLVCEGRTSTR